MLLTGQVLLNMLVVISSGTHLQLIYLRLGMMIRTIQELMGHKDVSNTMIYTHVLNKGGHRVKSPVDMFIAGLG